jgi:putative serine protease PepD
MSDRRQRVTLASAAVLIAIVGGVVGGVVVHLASGSSGTVVGACDAIEVAAGGLPSVVTIAVRRGQASGSGSGAVIRSGGYILTNDHVISPAVGGGTATVTYNDGKTSPATLVGRDPDTDLAVVKVAEPSSDAPVIAIGSSADVVVGQPVVALGAPLGLSGTVTSGIVSALDRELTVPGETGQRAQLVGAIQTDASINPGNSGGPLVDCASRLVGVNTAIATVPNASGGAGGGSVGLGFAIPADLAVRLSGQIIEKGRVSHPTFGLEGQTLPPTLAANAGLPQGIYVQSVVPGGPAADAGLRRGDVLIKIDGRAATSTDALVLAALTRSAGDAVDVSYVRNGQTRMTSVTLADSSS